MSQIRKGTRMPSRPRLRRNADALRILDRITGRDPKLRDAISQATLNAELAEMLYAARKRAGLTQTQLAERVGTRQPVIARLEDADYNGHSLSMLQRISGALLYQLRIVFVPLQGRRKATA